MVKYVFSVTSNLVVEDDIRTTTTTSVLFSYRYQRKEFLKICFQLAPRKSTFRWNYKPKPRTKWGREYWSTTVDGSTTNGTVANMYCRILRRFVGHPGSPLNNLKS